MLGQLQQQPVDFLGVERRGVLAVVVGVADDQLATRRRADQQVDAEALQRRALAADLLAHRLGFRQVGEGAVVHAGQAGEHRMLQVQRLLRGDAQHLQAADLRLQRAQLLGEQGQVVVTGADDDLPRLEAPGGGVQQARLDVAHQGGEMELHVELAGQPGGQRRQCLARVQLLVVEAVQGGAVVAEAAGVDAAQRLAAEQLDAVAVLAGAAGAEGFQQPFLGFAAGEQQRALALDREARGRGPAGPDRPAGAGQVEHRAGRLAGDQAHAEVAHRGAEGALAALEHAHLEAATGGGIGVSQAEDAGADDGDVAVVAHAGLLTASRTCRRSAGATRRGCARAPSRPRRSRWRSGAARSRPAAR